MTNEVEVLIPAYGRPAELAVTLAGLAAQPDVDLAVVLSDQSPEPLTASAAVMSMVRVLRAQGRRVDVHRHLPPRGMAEQRQFLLERSRAPYVLYLDADVWLEPGGVRHLVDALRAEGCGFVGYAPQGLSYLDSERPDETAAYEPWAGPVMPERIDRESPGFGRWPLHNAANLTHLARRRGLGEDDAELYKVAWIGGCVLYRRDLLVAAGGYGFHERVPADHAGEDVLAQWNVMALAGGAGLLPSRAVHLEAATTLPHRPVEAYDVVPPTVPRRSTVPGGAGTG